MKKSTSWLKIILVLGIAFLVAALLHGLLQGQWFAGLALKAAFLATVLGFVVLAWDEAGFFFALGSAVILSLMAAVTGSPPLLNGLYTLIFFTLFAGLMFLGDWVSRKILVLRAVVSLAGGVVAGVILVYLLPLIVSGIPPFMQGLSDKAEIISYIEISGGVAVAVLVARLIGGTKKESEKK
ncbi:hypothetical protein JXM67_07905 [candidate division WOR-3 bacterium]|nr:hypothetical protein [candidate division WOR-3 bacterium]